RRMSELRRQLAQYADIVRSLEFPGKDQRLAADLVQRVFELGSPIGRIDIDQDQSGLGSSKLSEDPLAIVRRPDTDAVARLQTKCQQAGGEFIDLAAQFAVGPPNVLMPDDQRRPVRILVADGVEEPPDGFADQRNFADAIDVALRERRHCVSSGFIPAIIEREKAPL